MNVMRKRIQFQEIQDKIHMFIMKVCFWLTNYHEHEEIDECQHRCKAKSFIASFFMPYFNSA